MAAKEIDSTTEEKIKAAAKAVFTRKGYAATRTRDIAEEAGINLALLNYYFRSKEKLFDMIMMENFASFIRIMAVVINDDNTTLVEKVERITENYFGLFTNNPDLPFFVMNEIRLHPDKLVNKTGIKEMMQQSVFFKQLTEATGGRINPFHLFINIMGMVIFPFIASPLIQRVGDLNGSEYIKLMEERKKLVPQWFETILKST